MEFLSSLSAPLEHVPPMGALLFLQQPLMCVGLGFQYLVNTEQELTMKELHQQLALLNETPSLPELK